MTINNIDEYEDVLDNRKFEVKWRANILAESSPEIKIAVGFFYLGGFDLLRENLQNAEKIKLLIGRKTDYKTKEELVRGFTDDMDKLDLDESKDGVKRLYEMIQMDKVEVRVFTEKFFHPKLYLFEDERKRGSGDAIVGSSNLSEKGLTSNVELNIEKSGFGPIRYLNNWFDELWEESEDFKEELLEVKEKSQFEPIEIEEREIPENQVSPFTATKLFISEQLKEEIKEGTLLEEISGEYEDNLPEFQNDAVRAAEYTLNRYNGVILADSVGLGKSYIGGRLLQKISRPISKVLVVCPKRLEPMWNDLLKNDLPLKCKKKFISHSELSRLNDKDIQRYRDFDVILIDEAHNLRNRSTSRYEKIQSIGRKDKKYILLTATPVQNSVRDLDNIIKIFADDSDFELELNTDREVSELFKEYDKLTEKDSLTLQEEHELESIREDIGRVLEEVVISRTRDYITETYEEIYINGEEIKTPVRNPNLVTHEDEGMKELYLDIINTVTGGDDEEDSGLNLPYIKVERYGDSEDEFEFEYNNASVLLVILLFKRLESSLAAFKESIERLITREELMERMAKGDIDKSQDRVDILDFFQSLDEEGIFDDIDIDKVMEGVERLGDEQRKKMIRDVGEDLYDLKRLKEKAQKTLEKRGKDAKIERLKELLHGELEDEKVLIFTQYITTAEYIYKELIERDKPEPQIHQLPGTERRIGYVHGNKFDTEIVNQFAPESNNYSVDFSDEIDILITTDVLGEGQNLQDSRVIVNYDLHWNPMKMEQRIGRIDRIDTKFDELLVYNFSPTRELEDTLGILETIRDKIRAISETLGHESYILDDTENLVKKNIAMYADLDEEVFDYGKEGLIGISSKYDRLRSKAREFCEENNISIDDLRRVDTLKDTHKIAFKGNKGLEGVFVLAELLTNNDNLERKSVLLKEGKGLGDFGVEGLTFKIEVVEDDELVLFDEIKSESTSKQEGNLEKIETFINELKKPETWNDKILSRDIEKPRKQKRIEKTCNAVISNFDEGSEINGLANKILEIFNEYDISDYKLDKLDTIHRKRRRLGWETTIKKMYELLKESDLLKKSSIDDVRLYLAENIE